MYTYMYLLGDIESPEKLGNILVWGLPGQASCAHYTVAIDLVVLWAVTIQIIYLEKNCENFALYVFIQITLYKLRGKWVDEPLARVDTNIVALASDREQHTRKVYI